MNCGKDENRIVINEDISFDFGTYPLLEDHYNFI